MPYVKLDCGILDSTLWLHDAGTCKVWITMLAMTGPDGICPSTAPGIARRANLDLEIVRNALEIFQLPDPDSRTLEDDGRRVRRINGGFLILNYEAYRNKDHTAAERQKRYRERKKEATVTRNVVTETRHVTEAEAEAEAEVNTKTPKKSRTKTDQPLPEGWSPSGRCVDSLKSELGLTDREIGRYVVAFTDLCAAKGYRYKNHEAAFRNCVRADWPRLRTQPRGSPEKQASIEDIARDRGMQARPGESWQEFEIRVRKEVAR